MSGKQVHRAMTRCKICRAWWSSAIRGYVQTADGQTVPIIDVADTCGCGGDLEVADMTEHMATLSYVPFTEPPKKA